MNARVLISGSVAYDTIMVFDGHFKDHILPDRTHMLSVSFLAPRLKREFGGTAANIAYNLVRVFTDGVAIGPILMGVNKPVHILTTSATSRRILNMTAIAAVDAQIRKQLEAEKKA